MLTQHQEWYRIQGVEVVMTRLSDRELVLYHLYRTHTKQEAENILQGISYENIHKMALNILNDLRNNGGHNARTY